MYRYSLEELVFIVKTYWITGSIKNLPEEACWTVWWPKPVVETLHSTFSEKAYLIFSCCQLPFSEFPKHNRTSLQVWYANVLYFCSFCKPTFSGATREWDALYKSGHYQWERNQPVSSSAGCVTSRSQPSCFSGSSHWYSSLVTGTPRTSRSICLHFFPFSCSSGSCVSCRPSFVHGALVRPWLITYTLTQTTGSLGKASSFWRRAVQHL
jgi:hypothetical protein